MSSLGHSAFHAGISGLRARSALTSAYQQGDVKKVKRFFKTVDIGGKVGGLFMALILVALSISMFMTAFSSRTDGSRTSYPRRGRCIAGHGSIRRYRLRGGLSH